MTTLDFDRPNTPLAKLLSLVEARTPARFQSIVAQARRDVAVVEGRLLLGEKPSPLVTRRSSSARRQEPVAAATAAPVPQAAPALAPASVEPPNAKAATRTRPVSLVTVRDGSKEHVLEVPAGDFLLETALAAGVNVPFSCTLGGCGTCKVHLVSGEIEMEEPNCLTPEEAAAGLRLICVGRPVTATCVVRVEREPS